MQYYREDEIIISNTQAMNREKKDEKKLVVEHCKDENSKGSAFFFHISCVYVCDWFVFFFALFFILHNHNYIAMRKRQNDIVQFNRL